MALLRLFAISARYNRLARGMNNKDACYQLKFIASRVNKVKTKVKDVNRAKIVETLIDITYKMYQI